MAIRLQGFTLESWPVVGLSRLPLPVAGAQLALAEQDVSDQPRAIEREARRRATSHNCSVSGSDPHDCFTSMALKHSA
jgi:hypothetical protein